MNLRGGLERRGDVEEYSLHGRRTEGELDTFLVPTTPVRV